MSNHFEMTFPNPFHFCKFKMWRCAPSCQPLQMTNKTCTVPCPLSRTGQLPSLAPGLLYSLGFKHNTGYHAEGAGTHEWLAILQVQLWDRVFIYIQESISLAASLRMQRNKSSHLTLGGKMPFSGMEGEILYSLKDTRFQMYM